MTADDCIDNKFKLAEFYKKNIDSCSFMDSFTTEEAHCKIESLIEHVSNGKAIVFGYFDESRLVGYIWAYEHKYRDERRVYVSEVRVEENYRGKGIGHQLLRAVQNTALDMGYKAMYIHAEATNVGAIKLYEKEGYELERVQLRKQL